MMKRKLLQGVAGLFLVPVLGRSVKAQEAKPRLKAPFERVAVVYFTKTGHTESVAQSVRYFTGADLFRVETQEPYPQAYRRTTEVVKQEIEDGVERPLKLLEVDLTQYDVVVLATPTWWHHVSQPLKTWLKSKDFNGKYVLTCNTHGGGGVMHTREDFEAWAKTSGARLGTHLTVFGSAMENSSEVRSWLRENEVID